MLVHNKKFLERRNTYRSWRTAVWLVPYPTSSEKWECPGYGKTPRESQSTVL